jgi:hypothetical protein
METGGIWEAIVKRITDNGFPAAAAECDEIMQELRRKERAEVGQAIAGEGYRTLWPVAR